MTGILNVLLADSAFIPVNHTYPTAGTFTETIPAGAHTMVIEASSPSGNGGTGISSGCTVAGGGGGAGNSYCKSSYALTSANWGQTVTVVVGTVGSSNTVISSGTFSITTLTAALGGAGGNSPGVGTGGTGGTGGAASGGTITNTTGNGGAAGQNSGAGGLGGAGGTGIAGTLTTGAAGGHGGSGSSNIGRTLGVNGNAAFSYT